MAQETQPGDACTAGETGYFRHAGDDTPGPAVTGENFMFCDGANWVGFFYYDDAETNVTLAQRAHFIGSGQAMPVGFDDGSSRMFFYPDKKAFRGGETTSADANIGTHSFTWGAWGNEAGNYSVALGGYAEASGDYSAAFSGSFAYGNYSFTTGGGYASGDGAAAIGAWGSATGANSFISGDSSAYGNYSIALGAWSTSSDDYSIALGGWSTAAGKHSFAGAGSDPVVTSDSGVAFGNDVTVGDGQFVGGSGNNPGLNQTVGEASIGFGLQTGGVGWTYTPPKITGDRTVAFFFDGDTSNANVDVDVATSDAFVIYGGKVGIGMINPSVELDVTGDIEYTGTITDVSDRRLKSEIEDLPDGQLEKILDLQGVSFKMKDDPKGRLEFGLIAQDVQPYYPELVNQSADGMLSVNYVGLIAPMAKAMEEQNIIIKEQRALIEELANRLTVLEEKNLQNNKKLE